MSERLPHEKGFHVSWDQLHRDSRALAWRLDDPKLTENGWLLRSPVVAWHLQ